MPLPIMAAIAAAQAAMGIAKAISGGVQKSQAKKQLNALHRPMMQIPPEAQQALLNAQKQSLLTQLPGEDIMKNNIMSNTQANVNALGETATGGSLLEGTNRAYQQGANQISQLDIAAAQFNAANQGAYRQELGQMANLKNQQFQVNELQPYEQKYQELTNQRSAGQQNLWGGIGMAAQAAGSYLGMKQEQNLANTMYGSQNTSPTSQPTQLNAVPALGMNYMQKPQMQNPLAGSLNNFNWNSLTPNAGSINSSFDVNALRGQFYNPFSIK